MDMEIKVLRCKGLTGFNFFQKLSIYTNVSIKHEDERIELSQQQKQEEKTPVDEEGDGNPEWNHTINFDLRPLETIGSNFNDLSVVFEFRHQGQLFGDKTVGEVRVPLTSLIDSVGSDVVRFVSYEVRSPEGKHNGILDFSYKLFRNENDSQNHISGYHHHHHHHHHNNSQHLDWHNNHNHNSHAASHGTSLDVHVSEYHHNDHGQILHHHHQHYQLNQQSSFDSEKIEYPKIDLENWSAGNHFSTMTTNISRYPPPPPSPVVYPPPQQYQWSPPPHFPPLPPPPPPPPVVYPVPRYGDPHWAYYRPPPGNNQQNGYRHW